MATDAARRLTGLEPSLLERGKERMIQTQLVARGVRDPRVIDAMRRVPRHQFVDEALVDRVYSDDTLPIGEGQTLSQPYTVARMSEALLLTGNEEVLEIGTGSGYQAAVLSLLCQRVYTIERLPNLADTARRRLRRLGFHNIIYRTGDGSLGWPEEKLFQRIMVTAGAPVVPERLIAQLAPGGILLLPEGGKEAQKLMRLTKKGPTEITRENLEACRFVPLVGAGGWGEEKTKP